MTQTLTRPPRGTSGRTRAPQRLRGRAHKAVLTAHILSSVGWFGAAVLVAFCAFAAATTSDSTHSEALYRTIETAPWLSVPLGLVAVATGVVLGVGTKWGLVLHWWVVAKIGIAVAVLATDPLVLAPAARDALTTGDTSGLFGPTVAHVVMLAVATILSVYKPRGRTPRGRRRLRNAGG